MSLKQNKTNNTIQVFWFALSTLSSFALSMITSMILSRYFPKEDYGTYRQIIFLYNTLLVVFAAGLPRVFSYYLPRYDYSEGKSIVIKVTTVLLFLGIIFSSALYFFSSTFAYLLNNPDIEISLKLFSLVPTFLLPTLGIEGIFSTYKMTRELAIFTCLSKFSMLLILVLPVIFFGLNYQFVLIGWVIASLITFLMALYFKNLPFRNVKKRKTSLNLNEILKYSLPLLLASISSIAIKSADQFYISRYFGQNIFADFSNGFMELPLVSMVTYSISAVLMPVFSKIIYDNSETSKIIELWQNAIIKSATIIYPLVVFFIVFSKESISLLYSARYLDSSVYFRIALFANFFNVIMFSPILLSLGKTRLYSSILVFFAIEAWLGNYIVIKLFNSPVSIAIFSTISTILVALVAFYFTSKTIKVSFFSVFPIIKLLKILSHSIFVIFLIKSVLIFVNISDFLLIKIIISFILYFSLLLISSKFFNIRYFELIKPLLLKFNKKNNE